MLTAITSRNGKQTAPGFSDFKTLELSCFSHVQLFGTPWNAIHQAPLSWGFPRQEYWSRLPFPPPGDLPYTRIKLSTVSPALQTDSLPLLEPGNLFKTLTDGELAGFIGRRETNK